MKPSQAFKRSIGALATAVAILPFAVLAFTLSLIYHGHSLNTMSQLSGVIGSYIAVIAVAATLAAWITKKVLGRISSPPTYPAGRAGRPKAVLGSRHVIAIASVLGAVDLGLSVVAAMLLVNGTAGTQSDATPFSASSDPSVPNTQPIYDLPPEFEDTKCMYNVEGQADLPKEPHEIQPRGKVEQEFVATEPYIWWLDAIIGYDPSRTSRKPGPVQIDLLDDDRHFLARNDEIRILNNRQTKFLFQPVKVEPGKRYWMRVENTSGITLGIYMRYLPEPNDEHRKPAGAETTLVYGELHRDNGERQEALVGCVAGARRTRR